MTLIRRYALLPKRMYSGEIVWLTRYYTLESSDYHLYRHTGYTWTEIAKYRRLNLTTKGLLSLHMSHPELFLV